MFGSEKMYLNTVSSSLKSQFYSQYKVILVTEAMKSIVYLCKVIVLAFIFVSCNRETENEITTVHSGAARASEDIARYDPLVEKVAKNLAEALENVEVRRFIKTEASKKFDGDFDILLGNAKDSRINGKALKGVLRDISAKGEGSLLDVDQAVSSLPLLNISVPIGMEKWKEESFIPLVVAFPDIRDESKLDKVKAYNSKGEVVWLDIKSLSDDPIIVIGLSEENGH